MIGSPNPERMLASLDTGFCPLGVINSGKTFDLGGCGIAGLADSAVKSVGSVACGLSYGFKLVAQVFGAMF